MTGGPRAGRPAVFLDRDGVLVEPVVDPRVGERPEAPLRVEDVRLVPGAARAVARLRDAGFVLIGASNQPSAAKGIVALEDLRAVHERVVELLAREGEHLDAFEYCLHHPDGPDPELGCVCECRKPAPGLLLRAVVEHGVDLGRSWMVGDSDSDVQAGAAAGTRTVLIRSPRSRHRRRGGVHPDLEVDDLRSAAEAIVGPHAGSDGPPTPEERAA